MLRFAGVDLHLPDPEGKVQAWIDRYRPLDAIFPLGGPTARAGRARPQGFSPHATGLPTFNWQQLPPRWRLNSLWWPTGASRFAVGLFMTTLAKAAAIQTSIAGSSAGTLVMKDGTRTLTATMYALPMLPVGAVATDNPVVLLPLVDRRYFWQTAKAGTFNIGPTSTWANVRDQIVGGLGVSVLQPEPAGYEAPDWSEFDRWYENPALLMDGYAATVGQRFVATLSGEYALQQWDVAEPIAQANLDDAAMIAGGALLSVPAIAPGAVTVVFPKRQGGIVHQNGACEQIVLAATAYGFDAAAPGNATIHSTYQADFSLRGGTADNLANVTTLAGSIARDFYGWKKKQYSATLPGLAGVDWALTGYDDYLWFMLGTQVEALERDDDDPEGFEADEWEKPGPYLAQTLVQSLPHNFGTEENLAQSPSPTAPRTFRPMPVFRAELQGTFGGGEGSLPNFATGRLLYDSVFGTGTMAPDSFDVKIYDTLRLARGDMKDGDGVWVSALGADSEMFELIAGASGDKIKVFESTEAVTAGGHGAAVLCALNGGGTYDATAVAIVVDDIWSRVWGQMPSGARGLCYAREDGARYNIIWAQRPDLLMRFQTYADRPAAQAFIEGTWVRSYADGDLSPAANFTPSGAIHDPEFLFPRALAGGYGLAVYNNGLNRYEVVVCQQQCLYATATINQSDGITDTTLTNNVMTGFTAQSFSLFNQTPSPAPTLFDNPYKRFAKNGDSVVLAWFEATGKWVCIGVPKKKKKIVFDMRIKSDKSAIEVEHSDCGVEYNIDPAWADKINLKKCSTFP